MSDSRSETDHPGEDFVVWPDAPEREARAQGLRDAAVRDSWEALAPAEWNRDTVSSESQEPVVPSAAARPQRFYPASRQWFRTTTPLAAADAREKWWQVATQPAASPDVAPVAAASQGEVPGDSGVSEDGFAKALAPSDLLSPEAIWEMAAEELEQASRLRAHPVTPAGAVGAVGAAPGAGGRAPGEPAVGPGLPEPAADSAKTEAQAVTGADATAMGREPAEAREVPRSGSLDYGAAAAVEPAASAGTGVSDLPAAAAASDLPVEAAVPEVPVVELPAAGVAVPAARLWNERGQEKEKEELGAAAVGQGVAAPDVAAVAAVPEVPVAAVPERPVAELPVAGVAVPAALLWKERGQEREKEALGAAAVDPVAAVDHGGNLPPVAAAEVSEQSVAAVPEVPVVELPAAGVAVPAARVWKEEGKEKEEALGAAAAVVDPPAAVDLGGSLPSVAAAGVSERPFATLAAGDSGDGPRRSERVIPWPAAPLMAVPEAARVTPEDDSLSDFLAVEVPPLADPADEGATVVGEAVMTVAPEKSGDPVEAIPLARAASPFQATKTIPAAAADAEESEPMGDAGRRRRRGERRASRESVPVRGRWLGRCAVLVGVLLVAGAVAAVLTRDQWPPEWRRQAREWREQATQFFWPEANRTGQRGVLTRPGEVAADTPASAPEPPLPAGTGPRRPAPLPSFGPGPSPVAGSTMPSGSGEEGGGTKEGAAAAGLPSGAGAGAPPPPEEIPVRRTEPVPEAASLDEPEAVKNTPVGNLPVDPAAATTPVDQSALLQETDQAETTAERPPFAPLSGDGSVPAPSDSAMAEGVEVVRRLVNARSADEVLPLIADAAGQEAAVRSYYDRYPPRPLTDAVIEHSYTGAIPATGGQAHIFNVLTASHPRGFPVSAEATPDGYRVDWYTFIQWRDQWLKRFLLAPSDQPQTLAVVLRRTHYFNDDVPDLDNKLAFKISSAVPDDEGVVVFVDKNSEVGRSLAAQYEWRIMYFPVVEVQWERVNGEFRYPRLKRIIRPTWRHLAP